MMFLLSGCSTVGYYTQAVLGQADLVLSRQPVERVLAEGGTSDELRARLQLSEAILAYADRELGLPAQGRYSTYVETGRDAVVYNVVAAPGLSLDPLRWCYPIVGCVPYRGYFRKSRAVAMASTLQGQGYEVHVGSVPAYSTLGWFDDPLLDTFLDWPPGYLANLLIHELVHGRVWVKGDAEFNESLAAFVGDTGARAWLAERAPDELRQYVADEAADAAFSASLIGLRSMLEALYRDGSGVAEKRLRRTQVFDRYRACYRRHRDQLGDGRYDTVVDQRLNNAYLAARQTYDRLIPAFGDLFAEAGWQWPAFWSSVETLAALPRDQRESSLASRSGASPERSGKQQIADRRDDKHADEVGCEPFLRHVLRLEGSG